MFDPDLAIETVAVPAEFGIGNIFHIQKLKTAKYRIVFRDLDHAAFDGYLDEPLIWLEHLVIGHFMFYCVAFASELCVLCEKRRFLTEVTKVSQRPLSFADVLRFDRIYQAKGAHSNNVISNLRKA